MLGVWLNDYQRSSSTLVQLKQTKENTDMKQKTHTKNLIVQMSAAAFMSLGTLSTTALAGPMVYTLADDGTALLGFDLDMPNNYTTVMLNGDASALDALDIRPLGGALYGYSDTTDSFYTIDPITGNLTLASVSGNTLTNTKALDIDFNPTIDRLRIVTATEQNIVYNPINGVASDAATTPLFYGMGDINEGENPNIVANGYTNSEVGDMTTMGTVQYVIDSELDILATLANNAGTLATVGELTLNGMAVDVNSVIGFDIFFDTTDFAYLLIGQGMDRGLYSVDLMTAELALVVDFAAFGLDTSDYRSLAIAPEMKVSAPATLALVACGLFGLAGFRRKLL